MQAWILQHLSGRKFMHQATGPFQSVSSGKRGMGNYITINHGFGYSSLYAHLESFNVKTGTEGSKGRRNRICW